MLASLDFSIHGNFLRSRSHPYFNTLHVALYPNNIKSLSAEFLTRCTHPLFLTSLYLDDGSLTISYSYNKKNDTVYCHPSIILYTLNFTRPENERLAAHLNKTFGTHFVVSNHPDGHQTLLKINKEKEVRHLLKVIEPHIKEIPSMAYKTSIVTNVDLKKDRILQKFHSDATIITSKSSRRRPYTPEEIQLLVRLKTEGMTDSNIANRLGRTYWSVVYKIKDLRQKSIL